MSTYRVFSGPNTGKYGPYKTMYLDTFHAVLKSSKDEKSRHISQSFSSKESHKLK